MNMGEKNAEMKRQQIRKGNLAGKTLVLVGVIVTIVLVFIGARNYIAASRFASNTNAESLGVDLAAETTSLRDRQAVLVNKGVIDEKDSSDKEGYELYLINKALDTSYNNCASTEFLESEVVGRYCDLRTELAAVPQYTKDAVRQRTVPYFIGAFMILVVFLGGGIRLIKDARMFHEKLDQSEADEQ